jgi:hypothetical protein
MSETIFRKMSIRLMPSIKEEKDDDDKSTTETADYYSEDYESEDYESEDEISDQEFKKMIKEFITSQETYQIVKKSLELILKKIDEKKLPKTLKQVEKLFNLLMTMNSFNTYCFSIYGIFCQIKKNRMTGRIMVIDVRIANYRIMIDCIDGNECKIGSSCLFKHDQGYRSRSHIKETIFVDQTAKTDIKPCRFDGYCLRTNCWFKHTNFCREVKSNTRCFYGTKCARKATCSYKH